MSHLSPFPFAPFGKSLFLDNAPFFFFFRFLFSCSKWQNLNTKKAVLSKRHGPWLSRGGVHHSSGDPKKVRIDLENLPWKVVNQPPPWCTSPPPETAEIWPYDGLMIKAYKNHWFPLIRPAMKPLGGTLGLAISTVTMWIDALPQPGWQWPRKEAYIFGVWGSWINLHL